MKANNDVTEALRRTVNLMQGELERSVLSTQMLDASTAALRSTSSIYDTLDGVLMTAKQLVTALEKADRMDKLLITAGLVFFFLVVLFILKQRVIDRGIRIALFWTRFIPRNDKAVGSVLEQGDHKATDTATSIATSITTLAASVLSSASIANLVDPISSSLPSKLSLSQADPIGTLMNVAIDEQPVPLAYADPRDEL